MPILLLERIGGVLVVTHLCQFFHLGEEKSTGHYPPMPIFLQGKETHLCQFFYLGEERSTGHDLPLLILLYWRGEEYLS